MRAPDYATFCAMRDKATADCDAAGQAMRAIDGVGAGPMGLTPDAVKASPEYRAARAAHEKAFSVLRAINGANAKRYAKQIQADITARRMAARGN